MRRYVPLRSPIQGEALLRDHLAEFRLGRRMDGLREGLHVGNVEF